MRTDSQRDLGRQGLAQKSIGGNENRFPNGDVRTPQPCGAVSGDAGDQRGRATADLGADLNGVHLAGPLLKVLP